MKEEKTLFQSPSNAEAVLAKRETLERFGWVLEYEEYDKERNVTKLHYARDLSIDENVLKKQSEEEAEEALLARKFAENNIAYCRRMRNQTMKPRSHKAIVAIMLFGMALCVLLVYLFRFADILTYGKFETEAETEHFKQTFVYEFPGGQTLFGKSGFSYYELIDFLTIALGGIAAIFLAVILVMRRNTKKNELIQASEREYLAEREQYFEALAAQTDELYLELNELADLYYD